jgi:hypothetical protein
MERVNINFDEIPWQIWEKPGAIGRVKMIFSNGKRVRMLELPAGFKEEKWCLIGHQGFVLSGKFTIQFEKEDYDCEPGMGFIIPDGIKHRSRGRDDEKTVVFVIDEVEVKQN